MLGQDSWDRKPEQDSWNQTTREDSRDRKYNQDRKEKTARPLEQGQDSLNSTTGGGPVMTIQSGQDI